MSENKNVTKCVICGFEIKDQAKKCTKCGEWQNNLVRYTNFSVPVLSLCVALSAIIVSGWQDIRNLIFGPQPKLLIGASEPSDSNTILLTFTNEGDASSRVERIECSWTVYLGDNEYDLSVGLEPNINPLIRPQQTVEREFYTIGFYYSQHMKEIWFELSNYKSFFLPAAASACCGEPTATCSVYHQDGSGIERISKFSTNKMRSWYKNIESKLQEELSQLSGGTGN